MADTDRLTPELAERLHQQVLRGERIPDSAGALLTEPLADVLRLLETERTPEESAGATLQRVLDELARRRAAHPDLPALAETPGADWVPLDFGALAPQSRWPDPPGALVPVWVLTKVVDFEPERTGRRGEVVAVLRRAEGASGGWKSPPELRKECWMMWDRRSVVVGRDGTAYLVHHPSPPAVFEAHFIAPG